MQYFYLKKPLESNGVSVIMIRTRDIVFQRMVPTYSSYSYSFRSSLIGVYKKEPETSGMGTLSWNHSLKYNISSYNQAFIIIEAPLDSIGFFA